MLGFDFYKRHWGPIGLELSSQCIRMVQLYETSEGVTHAATYKLPFDHDDKAHPVALNAILRRMLAEYDLHGRRAVLGLPSELLRATPVRIPEADCQRSVEEAARQAAWRLGWDPDLYAIEAIPAGHIHQKDQAKVELLLMAVKNQDIRDLLGTLEGSDIEVVGLDPLPCAVFRNACRSMKREDEEGLLTAFVHVGRNTTQVIFGQEEEISFIKTIPLGTENFISEITQKLDVEGSQAELLRTKIYQDPSVLGGHDDHEGVVLDQGIRQVILDTETVVADELCKELSLCLRYYNVTFRGQRVQQVMFSGGAGDEIVLQNRISQVMHVPVKSVDSFAGIRAINGSGKTDNIEESRQWAVAMGLSLKGFISDPKKQHWEDAVATKPLLTI